MQANLALPQSAERAFSDEDGPFDYVFNLAAETKYGQSPDVSWHDAVLVVSSIYGNTVAVAVARCTRSGSWTWQ